MAKEKASGPVEVIAIESGHDGVSFRGAGERFLVDRSRLDDGSTWFREVTKDEPLPVDDPNAGNELGKAVDEVI